MMKLLKKILKKLKDNTKKSGTYARDLEISTICILFDYNIRLYPQNKNNKHIDTDIINILFINNNYFQLLIKNDYKKMNL